MNERTVKLIDQFQTVVGTAQVVDEGAHFGGTIDLHGMPAKLCTLFHEFEEIVNGQMFSFLDEIQGRIGEQKIKVVFDEGCETAIEDLQVFPSMHSISFRLAGTPVHTGQSS